MKIFIRCASCQKSLSVDAANEGKRARCPACGTIFEIRSPPGNASESGSAEFGRQQSIPGQPQYSYPGNPNQPVTLQSDYPTNPVKQNPHARYGQALNPGQTPSNYPPGQNHGGNSYGNTSGPGNTSNPYQPASVSGFRNKKVNSGKDAFGWVSIALGTVTFPILFFGCCCGVLGIVSSLAGALASGIGMYLASRCPDQTLKTIGIVVNSIGLLVAIGLIALQIFWLFLVIGGNV